MSRQTTVRWLVSILNKEGFAPVLTDEEIQQALQMEREQIIKSNRAGVDMVIDKVFYVTGEQYYNETYGGQE
jgi:hypothetical protein